MDKLYAAKGGIWMDAFPTHWGFAEVHLKLPSQDYLPISALLPMSALML
jgi:hypothetical protein